MEVPGDRSNRATPERFLHAPIMAQIWVEQQDIFILARASRKRWQRLPWAPEGRAYDGSARTPPGAACGRVAGYRVHPAAGFIKSFTMLAPILHQYATKSTFCTVIQVPVVVCPRVQFVTITLDVIWRPQCPPTAQSPLDHAASMALRDDCTVGGPYDSPSSRQLVQYWG